MNRVSSYRKRHLLAATAMLVWSILVAACDTGVDRFSDEESDLAFNIVGALVTEADTQFVRVQRIRGTVERTGVGSIDAVATLSDVSTGDVQVMTDSLVLLESGDLDHLFFATFRVEPGRRYELLVAGDDGDVTTANTTIPDRPPTAVLPAETAGTLTTQSLSWNGLTRTPENAVVIYEIAPSEQEETVSVEVPYTLRGRLVRDGWTAVIRLSDDLRIVRQELNISQDDEAAVFRGIGMRLRIPSPEWSQGEGAENIVGGVGFFASVGVFTERWLIGEGAVSELGFVNGQQQ